MRSRGAKTTDIVVLVVDSSEGVLEQTLESIRMIREAKTPMMVALNKIDRPGADVDGTKLALKEAGVDLEEFGGDVQAIPISALKGTNVDGLIEGLQGRPIKHVELFKAQFVLFLPARVMLFYHPRIDTVRF